MTDVPGPPAGNPGDVPSAGGNPTDPTIVQPVTAASAPFAPAPGGLVAEEDQPWYRSPGGIAAGAAVLDNQPHPRFQTDYGRGAYAHGSR